jgi:hypothetical protein
MGKQRKSKKLKRAYLKRFSATAVNAGSRMTPKAFAHSWLRAAGFSMPGKPRTPDGAPAPYGFDAPVPATQWRTHHIETKKKLIQSVTRQKLEDFKYIELKEYSNRMHRYRLFFSGTKFYVVHENYRINRVFRSCIYPTKDKAMWAINNNRVLWQESDSLTSPA